MKNFLSGFPSPEEIQRRLKESDIPAYREANGHIHTPYSFSAFDDLESAFRLAGKEGISALGINDFFVTDGYDAFYKAAVRYKIFPLFNIEFIGLMKEEQQKGIRINDPNNPGRIYFSGKGLDYPFHMNWLNKCYLNRLKKETQKQIREMVSKLNNLLQSVNPHFRLSFEIIKKRFANDLVRERHLARAVQVFTNENFTTESEKYHFLETLYGGIKPKANIADSASLENEIRSNLLKSGGPAYVREDERSFPGIKKIISLINNAGGIPCYPVLLDDASGNCTEFENDPEELHKALSSFGIGCIELIPGRNDPERLKDFVSFFNEKGYVITFGTEHNAPGMIPLTITARGGKHLDNSLKQISWEGACIIAAHQYLRAIKETGYILNDGKCRKNEREQFIKTGKLVIEHFLIN
jgi:hypothetical protein